ncbi:MULTISPECIES: serine/threonine-protein kinase [Actinoalloteichus]|uniref:Protein kinase family protein n=1 Tax=Actinoalloteichus fjordicus TaxID=1612552 RepID=A0AAC9L9M8_9PSEU|nr:MULTISPECIES: serine/threonine-protein kinase [Actinoalloteichus]APU12870.1 protein kinase family protein [Actinoalloteichus fjordicus]APU18842.1 protein kinase family protein [Actinoalloteichus sp. GBA129-24]
MDPLRDGDPRQVGAYRLRGRLGGGGMGQVFLGSSRSGRQVAVKLVRAELAEDVEFRRRFAVEVDAARRVGGFYTAQVVDAGPEDVPPWLVTAYIPGPSLQQAVEKHGPLPTEAVALLGAGLAEGLAAIHACGLVHRDLKPSNVILADDGPRVIDFGIARALDSTSHTLSRVVVGTPSFMSPEQARGQEIGPSSDVFSLGLILAFAATGRSPFGTGPAEAIVYRIVHDEPDLVGLPSRLAGTVRRCLAKDPGRRPSVADIIDELAEFGRTTTRWLPPTISTMIDERRMQTTIDLGSGPTAQQRRGGGTRLLDAQTGHPHRDSGRSTARRQDRAASTAALVLPLLCIPGLLFLTFEAAGALDERGAPIALLWTNLVLAVVEMALLVVGVLLLSQRQAAGRGIIVTVGIVVALHTLTPSLQAVLTGALVPIGDLRGLLVYVISPLTSVAAVAAVASARRSALAH